VTPAFVLYDVGVPYFVCASRVARSGVHITCVCVTATLPLCLYPSYNQQRLTFYAT